MTGCDRFQHPGSMAEGLVALSQGTGWLHRCERTEFPGGFHVPVRSARGCGPAEETQTVQSAGGSIFGRTAAATAQSQWSKFRRRRRRAGARKTRAGCQRHEIITTRPCLKARRSLWRRRLHVARRSAKPSRYQMWMTSRLRAGRRLQPSRTEAPLVAASTSYCRKVRLKRPVRSSSGGAVRRTMREMPW
jgi:hypothetical protein